MEGSDCPGGEDKSMMRVIRDMEPAGERVLALGTFDGVHLGHQALLSAGKRFAQENGILLRACSFDRHPLEVLRPEEAPGLLTTLPEKTELMARYGADELQLIPFTRDMADMAPEDFLRLLRETVKLRAVAAGWNYTFGKGGRGNADLLRKDGERYGYRVLIVPPVKTEAGEAISSTLIRKTLQAGNVEEAGRLMGHPYEIRGKVTGGKHLGRTLGVPTANVDPGTRKMLPAFGVYPCRIVMESGAGAAVVNIGVQPTLPSGRVTVEAHVLEGEHDLYGQCVCLVPGDRIRPERKFDSTEELTARIHTDFEIARMWYEKQGVTK